MPRTLVRFQQATDIRWAVQFDQRLAVLPVPDCTTGELIHSHWDTLWRTSARDANTHLNEVTLLSPVTSNQQFICQGINYRSHVQESGLNLNDIPFNTLFTKAGSSITSAQAPVTCPPEVALLDYEIELGLVMRRDMRAATTVAPDQLGHWLAGVTIVNDLSARDIQLPQGQFYKGKSYRGFAPVGPALVLLEPHEWARWPELRMRLTVNGQPRQEAYCGEMIHQPAATLSELSSLQDMHPGDLIATGTPAGCAARAPGKLTMLLAKMFLNDATKWKIFIQKGRSNPAYLRPGDRIVATIRTDDGAIDLGEQTTPIVVP